jgi:protein-S-isoprenylcysteine O-methyltransferase Ste14
MPPAYTQDPVIQGFIAVTASASTPRLRVTLALYLALVIAASVTGPRQLPAVGYYLAGIAGFVCVVLACLGRLWASAFIAGNKDSGLVSTGPYARCRHPLYACSILGALGLGLTTRSALLCTIVVALIAALAVQAALQEEKFLAGAFPAQFAEYAAATPNRWLPRRGVHPLPAQMEIRPAIFRKAYVDAGAYFLLYLLVALATEYRLASPS